MANRTAAPEAPPAAKPSHPDFAAVLGKAAAKDKANLQRHLDTLDALPSREHSGTWQRLVAVLAGLAPHALQTVGRDAVRFFIADGRYKLQVFAIEDPGDGQIRVYLPDVLDRAVAKKLVTPTDETAREYAPRGRRADAVRIDALDADNTVDAPAHFKFMLGLGRKALRVTLAAAGRPGQIDLVEALCGLAAAEANKENPA